MKKKLAICLVACTVLILAVFYLWGPAAVPAGQEPLLTLSSEDFGEFEKAFDAHADSLRLVLLVSPT